MRLPIIKSLHVDQFTGTGIDAANNFNVNAIIGEYTDGTMYATQRPSIDIWQDASLDIGDEMGRGIYYWEKASDWYIVNNDTVYKGDYGTALAQAISAGTKPVYFVEMVNFLVILDPENNQGWYIQSTASGGDDAVLNEITDVLFPPKQTPALQLTTGGAFLDGRLYVGTTDGSIWNSDSNTPVDWDEGGAAPAGMQVSAEREADGGVHIEKHHDHIVMFGTRTIEFFYNAANASPASPISRRTDIAYNMGLVEGDSVFREGDDIYFIGITPSGPLSVVRMSNFAIDSISEPDIDTFITNARLVETSNIVCSGFTSGKRTYYTITFYREQDGIVSADKTIVYDSIGWAIWRSGVTNRNNFPLVRWNIRSGSIIQSGSGIMANGDLINITDEFIPVDTVLASGYYQVGYINAGYFVAKRGSGSNIEFRVRTGKFDGGSSRWKFHHNLEVAADETDTAQTATIKWIDGNSEEVDLTTGRTINLDRKEKITRLGRFKRRNIELDYSGDEQIRVEGFDVELTEGGH